MVASFSEDILTEILKRLPIRSLIKFMLVQNSWCRLIQSSYFKTLYSHHQIKTVYIFFRCKGLYISLRINDKQCIQYPSLPHAEDVNRYMTTLGISHGLICYSDSEKILSYWNSEQIHLWNPIIKKYKTLPHSPILDDPTCIRFFKGLVFGYVPKINDYKLIEIVKYKHLSDKVGVLVYSLSTNSWKTVDKENFAKSYCFWDPVIVNGAAYWVGETIRSKVIVCFDIESEIIREIMLPPGSYDLLFQSTLVKNCSDLFLCYIYYDDNRILEMWILEKEAGVKDVWRKKITIDLDRIAQGGWWFPQCFWNNNEIILTNDGPTRGFRYMSYDIEKDEPTEIIDDLSGLCSLLDIASPRQINASLFVENLALLGENNS